MAAEEQTHREENQASASPESQVASPARLDSGVKTSRPWDKFVALVALVVVSTAAILALVLYKNAFSTAKDVIILVESCLIVAGTIAGAYLGVRPARLTQRPPPPKPPNEPPFVYNLRIKVIKPAAEAVEPAARKVKEAAESTPVAIAPVLAALAGFAGALIPLAYPAGLVALWIQLFVHFEYGVYKALYAASLARSAMVVEKVLWILLFSFFSALIPMWIWYAYARVRKHFDENRGRRRFKLVVVGAFGLWTSALLVLLRVHALVRDSFLFWLLMIFIALAVLFGGIIVLYKIMWSSERAFYVELVIWMIGSVAGGVLLARWLTGLAWVDASFRAGLGSPLIRAFVSFTVAEVILGGAILFYTGLRQDERRDEDKEQEEQRDEDKEQEEQRDEDKEQEEQRDEDNEQDLREPVRVPLFLGLVVVYVGSVAAGVCLAGLQNPSLPTVTLTVKHSTAKELEAGLLSNTGSYWYVVDYCNKEKANRFLVIPNTSVEDADAIVEDPVSMEGGRAGMNCPPETTIKSGSSGVVARADASFEFTGHDDGTVKEDLRFECRIDGSEYKSCISPKDYTKHDYLKPLNGEHTFWVRAKDEAGGVDDTPAKRTWSVDTIGPDTAIDSGPSGTIASRNAVFDFSSPQRGATFECKIDGADYKSCVPQNGYSMLSQGSHTFKARAKDALNNVDASPAVRSFTVDTVSPQTTIDSGPSHTVSSADAEFKFTSDEEPSTFECRIVGIEYRSCTSPMDYFGLLDGEHTFWVRAKDEAGNVDDTPAKRTWTVCRAADPYASL